MALSRQQTELLRWYAAGHSVQMVAQYIDVETRDVHRMLKELEVESKYEADRLLQGNQESDQLERPDPRDNLANAGEEVPEFTPPKVFPNQGKLQDYDKREIAKRGGNQVDLIPMSLQQAFRMDIRWRPMAEVTAKWELHAGGPEQLKAAVAEYSPSAFKRLYGED